jgi:small-conductance mechanosensitive channel
MWAEYMTWWAAADPWLKSGIVVAFTIVGAFVVKKLLLGRLERMAKATDNDVDDRLVQFFRSFFFVLVFFLALIWVLSIHGKKVSALLAGAGIGAIAVGLAAKETLADVLAGVFLITDRPLRTGDRVKIERIGRDWGGWGDVVDVGLRRTKVRNTDGVVVNYPNNILSNSIITNFSDNPEPVRVRVRFQVDYEADLELAGEVAVKAINRSEGVIPDTGQIVVRSVWDDTRGHAVAGVLMEGRYRIADVRARTRIRSTVLKNLLADLRAAEIPYPAPRVILNSDEGQRG